MKGKKKHTPKMVHHIELPNLGEEPSNCFITVLSEANGSSPMRKRQRSDTASGVLKSVSSILMLFRTKNTFKIIECIPKAILMYTDVNLPFCSNISHFCKMCRVIPNY